MQADTIIPVNQGVQAYDRYAYVNNNPVTAKDPTGHDCVIAGDVSGLVCPEAGSYEGPPTFTGAGENGGSSGPTESANVDVAQGETASSTGNSGNEQPQTEGGNNSGRVFLRALDRSVSNPKNYWLYGKDQGRGVSTFVTPPVTPENVFSVFDKEKLVEIPEGDLPQGVELVKTQGNTASDLLNENHYELRSPAEFKSMTWEAYKDWWNNVVAPQIAQSASNWNVIKRATIGY